MPTSDPESLFEAADNAIAEQARGYLDRARKDYLAASQAMEIAIGGGERRAEALDRLYGIAHDIKGQGITFGYSLASEICAQLCRLLVRRPDLDEVALRIAQAHVDGLGVVLEHGLAGEGGTLGRQLIDRLRTLAEHAGP